MSGFRSGDNMMVKGRIINESFNKKYKSECPVCCPQKVLFLCVPIQLCNLI